MPKSNEGSTYRKRLLSGIGLICIGIVSLGIGFYNDSLAAIIVGIVFLVVGTAIYLITQAQTVQEQNRALANLVFHEKTAILSGYLGKQEEQLGHDLQAALEFENWVEPILKQEFEELWQEFLNKETKPIVVKIGGSTLGNHDTTLQDLVALQKKGITPVVVHGGGNEVTEWLERMGISASFVRGLRVTDEETLRVVTAVLAGLINKELVAAINSLGGKAIGISGIDGALIEGKIKSPDMGYTGEVVKVNPESVIAILNAGYIPVIAPGGYRTSDENDDRVRLLNINGDDSASEIAMSLEAERLIFLTDVPGVQNGEGQLLSRLSPVEARALIESGVISGGMIPKVEGCLRALSSVSSTQIIDGQSPGALLAALERNDCGTIIE